MSKEYKKHSVALAAPSGGGKTTLCDMLLKKYPALCLSISHTTRKPRAGEQEGKHYFFVDEKKFKELIAAGAFIEWAHVHGNYYATGKKFLEDKVAEGRVVLLDIDVQGVESLKKIYGSQSLSVFVEPPNMQALEQRLRARQKDSEETIQQRLRNAAAEMAKAKDFDVRLVNSDLQATFAELCAVLEREVGLKG